jgi:TPR repeat protein
MKALLLLALTWTAPARAAAPSGADAGTLDGWVFRHPYYGLTWNLPEDASLSSASKTKKDAAAGLTELAGESLGAVFAAGAARMNVLLTLELPPSAPGKKDKPMLIAASERLPEAFDIRTGDEYVKFVSEISAAAGLQGMTAGPPRHETLGGVTFSVLETELVVSTKPAAVVNQVVLAAVLGRSALAFSLVCDGPAACKRGRAALDGLSLSTAAWAAGPAPRETYPPYKIHPDTKKARAALKAADLPGAVPVLRSAADFGDPEAQAVLAGLYFEGRGVKKDPAEGARLVRRAAEAGFPWAQERLSELYREGLGVKKDPAQAMVWKKKAALRGSADSMYSLAIAYQDGAGVERSELEALGWLTAAAQADSAEALFAMGDLSSKGLWGMPKSDASAYRWYSLAGERGHAEAQFKAGFMASMGDGAPLSWSKAVDWFRKAAEQGHAGAQDELAAAYQLGLGGLTRDTAQSAAWSRKSAEQGSARGAMMLGLSLLNGDGAAKDPAQAEKWLTKAAESGDADAGALLASLYLKGDQLPKDEKKAAYWERRFKKR